MRATVVVDNRKSDALPGEWGLCIYIEYGEKKILLDTGASELFAENAEKLGLDLSAVDAAVLSHAHYDHGNGMEAFFRRNDHAPFYVGPTCAADCYAGRWLFRRYIGIPPTVLSDYSRRIRYVREKRRFFPGLPSCPTPPRAFSRRAGGSICSGVWEAGGSRTTFPTSRAWCWRRRRAWLFSIAAPTPERTTS